MGERMRQGKARERAQRRGDDAEGGRREEAGELERRREGERHGRTMRGVPVGLTEGERLAMRRALEGVERLVMEQMERGLSEGRAGRWLVDEVRAWAMVVAAAVDGAAAAAGRPAAGEHAAPVGQDGGLTRRELEVLGLAARGMKGPAIARELALSAETVHTHQVRTCAKLGVSGMGAAVAKARELGLI